MDKKEKGSEERDLEYWDERWKTNNTVWHRLEVSRFLVAHQTELIAERNNIKIFVPLCGKTVDMKWFAELGHRVVGVESSHLPIEDFFKEHSMQYVRESVSDVCSVYKSSDDLIHIYHCDLFNFTPHMDSQFDAIWDRGSLVALNPGERVRYVDLMFSLMQPDCRYLLNTLEYDDRHYSGPPCNIPESVVLELYAQRCAIRRLCAEDALVDARKRFSDKIDYFRSCLYVIQFK